MPATRTRVRITPFESGRTVPIRYHVAYHGSVVGQVMLVCTAVFGLTQRATTARASTDVERPTFLAPLYRQQPRPTQEQVSYVALGGTPTPSTQPTVGASTMQMMPPDAVRPEPVGGGDARPTGSAGAEDPTRAFSEVEVDSAVVRDPDSEGPIYPPRLLTKGIEGSVVVSFIVDTTGRPVVRSFMALESTDVLFTRAVRDVLPRMKFTPAKRNGTRVRQEVEQRFTFRIPKPEA